VVTRRVRATARRAIDHLSIRLGRGAEPVDSPRVMTRARQLSDEDGFALLEVIISAALLAVMVIAVYTSFDFANRNAASDKSRAVAASLAQADQERLRALPVADLSKLADQGAQTQPGKTLDGITYTTTSQADWIADKSQSRTCTSNGAAADYLKIVSTVAAPAASRIKPVTLTSVVTPPVGTFGAGQGSLAVSVVGADANPKPGIAVTLNGASSGQTRSTDSTGCAFFGYQPTGAYTAGVAATGYVDPDGNSAPTKAENIASETVSTESFKYDVADDVSVTFDTQTVSASGTLGTSTTGASAKWARFVNSGMAAPRKFGGATPSSSISATGLFPFTDSYSVYAGDCDGALPASPATILATASGPPSVVVRVPTLVFGVTKNGATVATPTVKLTATGGGCSGTTTLSAGSSATTGRVWDALPFGTYNYCATDGTLKTTGTISNSNASGQTFTVDVKTGAGSTGTSNRAATSGTCP
jgi:Tfp pilus assembly protein PilV